MRYINRFPKFLLLLLLAAAACWKKKAIPVLPLPTPSLALYQDIHRFYIVTVSFWKYAERRKKYSELLTGRAYAAEIFLRESGSTSNSCAAHIHFTASKMIENELSGQFYLNNSGYSLPSETIQLQISVNLNYELKFSMKHPIKLFIMLIFIRKRLSLFRFKFEESTLFFLR